MTALLNHLHGALTKALPPNFKGVIEVKLRSGRVVTPKEIMHQGGKLVWGLDGDQCDIVEWRPLLDQSAVNTSDDKPVFTQEMADRSELPPVGSEFLHEGEVVLCISTTSHDGGVITFRRLTQKNGPAIDCCWNNKSWVKPIWIPSDTHTKAKAVDEMLSDSRCNGSVIEVALERLYDKGYRKC